MCEYCKSYWTTCHNCGIALCKECAVTYVFEKETGKYVDLCPDCVNEEGYEA